MIASSDADYKTASDSANGLTAMTGADLK
jgi:hypothetical protein